MNLATQAAALERNVGFAAAMYIFTRSLDQGGRVAVGGVVFQSQFAMQLRKYETVAGNATDLARNVAGLIQVIKTMPEDATERMSIMTAYAEALKFLGRLWPASHLWHRSLVWWPRG